MSKMSLISNFGENFRKEVFLMKFTTKEVVLVALFLAFIIVGAFIRIPVGTYVITLQPVFTLLAGFVLGAKLGGLAVAIYVLMGLIGLPVFTAGGGPQYALHPTFGFLFAFIIEAIVCGKLSRNLNPPKFLPLFIIGIIGLVIIYAIGLVHFYLTSIYVLGMDGEKVMALAAVILTGAFKDVIMTAIVSKIALKLYQTGHWVNR